MTIAAFIAVRAHSGPLHFTPLPCIFSQLALHPLITIDHFLMHITVGTQGIGYVEERVLLTAIPTGVTYVRSYDAVNVIAYLQRRLASPPTATSLTNCLHCDLGLNRVDLLHLVNTISCSDTPWIVSFEHHVPRWNPRSARGMQMLTRPACRRLLALSHFAWKAQLSLLEPGSALRDALTAKLVVTHPPQRPLISSYEEKQLSEEAVTCTFVGRDFWRKGGREVVEAFQQLRSEGEPVRLHVISSLEWGDYISGSTLEDARMMEKQMRSAGDWLIHDHELPNESVLRALTNSHIALLPTYDDTYGFSVLEAQASGTPIITTDICVMPEVNSNETGWLISLVHDAFGQALLRTPDDRRAASRAIVEGVYNALKSSLRDPSLIRSRGQRALESIRTRHAPDAYAEQLREIYAQALHPSR